MRQITATGLALIKHFEGCSLKVYMCPAGIWTIGYGHTGPLITAKTPNITLQEAEELLQHDLHKFEDAVLRLIKRPLTDGQFSALVSFCFNLGSGALQGSTLRMKCNRSDDEDVPGEFIKWVWAGGKKLPGLMKRRKAEAILYAS